MPFDSTTYPVKTADPLDPDAMIAWLETMPAEGAYDFWNRCGECLLHQFATAIGADWKDERLSFALHNVWGLVAIDRPHTYGAALSRFRALKES